jgi:hypothetical protein
MPALGTADLCSPFGNAVVIQGKFGQALGAGNNHQKKLSVVSLQRSERLKEIFL